MSLLRKALNAIRRPKETYRYEMQSVSPDGHPQFNWIDSKGNWYNADFQGVGLPKNAIKEYSDSAYEYQKKMLDLGNDNPWQTVRTEK